MRILFATRHSSRVAGAETYVATAVAALRARGHVVGLLAERLPNPTRKAITEAAITWCVDDHGEAEALRQAREWQPDVVYVHGVRSLTLEQSLLGIAPAVLFAHDYVGQCISGSRLWQATGVPCPRSLGPGCLLKYFPCQCGGRSPVTMWRDYTRQRARQALQRGYAAIIVASWHMAATFAAEGTDHRVHVLPIPVAAPVATAPRERGTPIRMVYVGRLERLKGVQLLIDGALEACTRLKTAGELRLIGDGPMQASLESDARRRQSAVLQIRVAGWCDEQQRDELLSRADLVLVPSVWPEPFGLVGLEAGRFGVPAAGFASGGIAEWLRDGVNGALASEPSARGLADAIVRCVADAGGYRHLSEGAIAAAARGVSPDKHAIALERLFNRVVQ